MNLKENIIQVWKNKGQILEGIKNSIFKREDVEDIANGRMAICQTNACGAYDTEGSGCLITGTQPCCSINEGGCGCKLSFAVRSLAKECPKGYWPAVCTVEEDIAIKENLEIVDEE